MHQQITIFFPGGPYVITGISAQQKEAIRQYYNRFTEPQYTGSVHPRYIRLEQRTPHVAPETKAQPAYRTIRFENSTLHIQSTYFSGRIHLDEEPYGVIETDLSPDADPAFLTDYILYYFLRSFTIYSLAYQRGALFHAAAAIIEGRGYLFAGPSGVGKSTLSRLLYDAGHSILSDDLNTVTVRDDKPQLLPLPLSRTFPNSVYEPAPLCGIFFLSQSLKTGIKPIGSKLALSKLFANTPVINSDERYLDIVIDNLSDILRNVRTGELSFSLTDDITKISRQLIDEY
jgi:hypothetical protein